MPIQYASPPLAAFPLGKSARGQQASKASASHSEANMSGIFIDPKDLPEGGYGLIQVLFLGAVYGFVLFNASNMISDGSELLLLVPCTLFICAMARSCRFATAANVCV